MFKNSRQKEEGTMLARPKTIRALLIAVIAVCAIASPLVDISVVPAAAQAVSVSVEFRTALEPYGAWQHHRRWGEVWIPSRAARDWQPYTVGHWVYSRDYGWYWAADAQEADWGLGTYHSGRWVVDDQFGWMWIPGTEWGPGWVQWRHGRQHVGWAPLPPDEVMVEYRERPQFWVFVRERDLVAPRITEVILPRQERELFFRDTAVVNRTVVLQDRRFAVNPGIPPTYIAAAYGRPIPSYQISPRVFAGTANLPGAVVVRADDFRNRERVREIARESTFVRQTTNTVAPARELPPLQPLGASERGRLGALPPRAAQPGFTVSGQNRPEGSNAPATPGTEPPTGQSPNRPAPSRQGVAPGQPLQQQGREGRRGAQPGRNQRNLREGGPAPSPNALGPSDEGRRGPQAGVPSTGGGAPSGRERELRNRPPEGVAPPQEPRGRERSGIESQGQRNQNLGGERGAAQRPAPAAPSQRPSAVERGPSPALEAPRSPAPAAEGPRPQSPTTGAAPQGGRAPPGGGGRREEQR